MGKPVPLFLSYQLDSDSPATPRPPTSEHVFQGYPGGRVKQAFRNRNNLGAISFKEWGSSGILVAR